MPVRRRLNFSVLYRGAARRKQVNALAAGATICVPGRAMLPEAILVVDAIMIRKADGLNELVIGEIKTYPDRGGHGSHGTSDGARSRAFTCMALQRFSAKTGGATM
jgi:hypothetical protein